MNEYKLKNNQFVKFNDGVISGEGKILGACSTSLPVIGAKYIIEVSNSNIELPNEVYPFKVIAMNESFITEIS